MKTLLELTNKEFRRDFLKHYLKNYKILFFRA